jgi:hypothetical protein
MLWAFVVVPGGLTVEESVSVLFLCVAPAVGMAGGVLTMVGLFPVRVVLVVQWFAGDIADGRLFIEGGNRQHQAAGSPLGCRFRFPGALLSTHYIIMVILGFLGCDWWCGLRLGVLWVQGKCNQHLPCCAS